MPDNRVPLPLPNGKTAFVSPEDWPRVSKLSWSDKGLGYVRAVFKKSEGGDGRIVDLGRFIMRAPPGYVVDHIDGNPLNNTRGNLQTITQSRNMMRRKDVMAGGIQRHKNRWRVRISIDGKSTSFGLYDDREAAEEALAKARALAWGPMNEMGAIP